MRILHVNLAQRGIGRYGLLFGHALGTLGGISTFSVYDQGLLESPFLRERIADTEYAALRWSGGNKWIALREIRRLAATFEPDVIHDSGGCYARSLPLWLSLRGIAPLVLTEHDPIPHVGRSPSVPERATRAMMPRLMSHVFVHGPACRVQLIDRGLDPEHISVIRHGHLGMFDRGQFPESVRRPNDILFFGELRYNKGVDLLPEIADRVLDRFPNAKFIVAGSSGAARDGEAVDLGHLLREMSQKPEFEVHHRFIPDEEVEYLFKRCAITVMPYREATQSGVAMIAMPLGSAVVATRVGDIPDVVQDGKTGCLAEPSAEAISRRIIDLLDNPDQLQRITRAASHFSMKECSWEAAASHVVQRCEALPSIRSNNDAIVQDLFAGVQET